LIRLLRSVYRRISGKDRLQDISELQFLPNILKTRNIIPKTSESDIGRPLYRELSQHLHDALYRKDRLESVVLILQRVQQTARNVRDRLSIDSSQILNRLEDFPDTPFGDPLELLDKTLFTLSAFSGLAMESMTRGLGWRFMDMGRRVERGMNLAVLIHIALPWVSSESSTPLQALLAILGKTSDPTREDLGNAVHLPSVPSWGAGQDVDSGTQFSFSWGVSDFSARRVFGTDVEVSVTGICCVLEFGRKRFFSQSQIRSKIPFLRSLSRIS